MTANEARIITSENLTQNQEITTVLGLVNSAALSGKFKVHLPFPIEAATKTELKRLGYSLHQEKSTATRQGIFMPYTVIRTKTFISWGENNEKV